MMLALPVARRVRQVGSTGLGISEFSFGGACVGQYGGDPAEDRRADAALATAWDAGIRHFDTAPKYGEGTSERRLGKFLSSRSPDDYTISTKVGIVLAEPGSAGPARRYDYTYDGIMRSYDESLARLGLASVDMLLVHEIGDWNHGPDDSAHHLRCLLDSGVRALAELRRSGVRAIGIGVNEVPICHTLLAKTDLDVILPAGRYTLLDNSGARLLDECARRNVAVLLAGIYNSGILATGPTPGALYQYRPASDEVLARTRAIADVCETFGVPLMTAAAQFAKGHPAVTSTIVASINPNELLDNLAAYESEIPPALWERLAELGLSRHHTVQDR